MPKRIEFQIKIGLGERNERFAYTVLQEHFNGIIGNIVVQVNDLENGNFEFREYEIIEKNELAAIKKRIKEFTLK